MDPAAYLRRIGYRGPLEPTPGVLRRLQLRHLMSVPFENLDVRLGRPILLDEAALFEKIVLRRRGGFCYELNGLFAWLLRQLGFRVTCLSASDAHPEGGFGPEFDHLTLLIQCPNQGAPTSGGDEAPGQDAIRWLADVGWGDTFRHPLHLDERGPQVQGPRAYRIEHAGEQRLLWQRKADGTWKRDFRFSLEPRQFQDFAPMCRYQQTSPDSIWTRQWLCTIATPQGRITLRDSRLIISQDGRRQERRVASHAEYLRLLGAHFAIHLEPEEEDVLLNKISFL